MREQLDPILCSDGFYAFFDAIQQNEIAPENLSAQIQENYHYIADELPVGRIQAHFFAPPNVFDAKGNNEHCFNINCVDADYENVPYTECLPTGENGRIEISFYPLKGCTWSQAERKALHFLAQVISMACSKAHLSSMMNRIYITDLLTGTSNIRGFMRFGERLFQTDRFLQYTGILINIKNFNYINQTVGSKQGDIILRQYAQSISNQLDSESEIFCRLGGDSFTMLVKSAHVDALLEFLSTIRIESTVNGLPRPFDIRSRIGLCKAETCRTMAELMNSMTAAFHMTKSAGSNDCVWFRMGMLKQALYHKEISMVFPKALQSQEFVVYYQPKVTLSDNHLCGCEALVRWLRNGRIVPPMDFIPVLEREGSICNLDFYMLERVCIDIRKWQAKGISPVRISVNFSKAHLYHPDLADNVLRILNKYEIDSKYIEIELTETSSYDNYENMFHFVQRMKENGVGTSIDDFGTGYSSLNLLKDLKVDIIKLDKSFLDNLECSGKADEIVIKNIVNMVSELNMNVIAEGVETAVQADFLRDIHCSMAQGYLFDRPLPHDEFEKRLMNRVYSISP